LLLGVLGSLVVVAGVGVVASPAVAQVSPGGLSPGGAVVEPRVWEELAAEGETTFWVYLEDSADLSAAPGIADRAARGWFVYEELTQTAEASQAALVELLSDAGAEFESYWIANTVRVVGGDADLLERIVGLPRVSQVTASRVYELPEPLPADDGPGVAAVEWGLDRINAPDVWDEFGAFGDGIVVGSIDTGALYTHEALVGQYRGNLGGGVFDHNYNWHDPSNVCGSPSLAPCDNNGHGTHVTGTMVGDDGAGNQIGVAPAAKWIAAKGCELSTCSDAALLSSGQFVLAPTDLQGNNPDPALRPHVVNNSWGGGANTDPWYQPTVQAWVAAGIFPQFANGNTTGGASCGSSSNPGNLAESYAAGAFDINDNIANFSNRGPSAWGGLIKPNLSAPGVAIRSSWNNGAYNTISGTSMASPHVAGTVALMWSAATALERDVAGTRDLLDLTAVDTEDLSCGGTAENNNVWGQGKLDAHAAVDQSPRGPVGTLSGVVTDAATGDPVGGAAVSITGEVERERTTAPDGSYSISLPVGDYTVTASAFGYEDGAITVSIVDGQTTTGDIALTPVAAVTVSGQVTDGSGHGWALYAKVEVQGTTLAAYTDPVTGGYSINLPENDTYQLVFTPRYPGYQGHTETVEVTNTDLTLNAALTVDQCANAPGYEFGAAVGVLGDFNGLLGGYLASQGIPSTPLTWSDDPTGFDVIIVNRPGNPGEQAFLDFLDATDASGTGLVMLDTWSTSGNGVWLLWQYVDNPATRATGFSSSIPYLFYEVTQAHPVLDGFNVGDEIVFDEVSTFKDHAWFGGYEGEGRQVIGDAGRSNTGIVGNGIAVQERDNNRHVLLSMHAAGSFTSPAFWTEDAATVFDNAVGWASGGATFDCVVLDGGLVLGQVSELNTGGPVAGATVAAVADPGVSAMSAATPDDPGLGDGFFWLFSPLTGEQEFTASASQFVDDTQTVVVVVDAANEANFSLGAGHLVVEPGAVSAELRLGQSAERTFTVLNDGTAPASVQLSESGGSFEILGAGRPGALRAPVTLSPAPETVGAGLAGAGLTPAAGLSGDASAVPGVSATPSLPPVVAAEVTITHSASQEIVAGNSVGCSPDGGFTTTENGYLRVFNLNDFGLGGGLSVTGVSFGVEALDPAQTLTVNLYTLQGSFEYANMTLIGSADATVDPTTLGLVTVPVAGVAPAGSMLVVEIDAPDMSGAGRFFVGSNSAGQSAPSYLRSDSCGLPEPTDTADLGFPGMHVVMNVTGQAGGGDVPWLGVDPQAFILDPGQSVEVTVSMDGDVDQPGTYTAAVGIGHDTPYQVDPVGVTMVVTPPNSWGKVSGTVSGVDCSGNTAPLSGAIVHIDGKRDDVTLLTDADGGYAYWMPSNNTPATLIVATGTHVPQTRDIRIKAKQELVEDFTLQSLC
jgi:subtilisin family serine protease